MRTAPPPAAKAAPGKVPYGTVGQGSLAHLTMTQVGNSLGAPWIRARQRKELTTYVADLPSQRERLTRQIADDAVGFNEAYGQAVSAQILLNILRSRDRLPRYYLAMTGISDSPSWSTTQSAAIGGIPLGGDISDGGSPPNSSGRGL